MDCVVTPLKTLMGFSVHLNVQVKFYNLPFSMVGNQKFNYIFIHNVLEYVFDPQELPTKLKIC
ncbi:integral membrane protein [Ligilactobacillus acidipiscis]|nr:integral membrane protein [Ligilactobacillus acidipiscis]